MIGIAMYCFVLKQCDQCLEEDKLLTLALGIKGVFWSWGMLLRKALVLFLGWGGEL